MSKLKIGDRIKKPKTKKGDPIWEMEYPDMATWDKYYFVGVTPDGRDYKVDSHPSGDFGSNYFDLNELELWEDEKPEKGDQVKIISCASMYRDSIGKIGTVTDKDNSGIMIKVPGIDGNIILIFRDPMDKYEIISKAPLIKGNAEPGDTIRVITCSGTYEGAEGKVGKVVSSDRSGVIADIPCKNFGHTVLRHDKGHYEILSKVNNSNTQTKTTSTMEPKYEGLYYDVKDQTLLPLINIFEQQLLALNAEYRGTFGLTNHSQDNNIAYFGATFHHYKKFNLGTQYAEAFAFAKELSENRKPKEHVIMLKDQRLTLTKDGIKLNNEGNKSIKALTRFVTDLEVSDVLWGHKTAVKTVQIGCTTFTLDELRAVLSKYKELFGQ